MNQYQPKDFKDLQDLSNAHTQFAEKLRESIENSQAYINELERQKRKLIEVASKLADPEMMISTFRARRQDFIDLVTEIEE